jgi:hypothetical protein
LTRKSEEVVFAVKLKDAEQSLFAASRLLPSVCYAECWHPVNRHGHVENTP